MFAARPEVFAHNVETVPRIFKRIRPAFRYERSLDVLTQARQAGLITKSNLILGMGEEPEEVVQALRDLHEAGTDIITNSRDMVEDAAAYCEALKALVRHMVLHSGLIVGIVVLASL